MNLESQTFWIVTFSSVLVIYGAFMAFSRWCFRSPAVPERKLAQLHLGLNQRQVQALLGKPWRERHRSNGAEWRYGHTFKHHRLILQFSEAGLLTQFEHVSAAEPNHHESPSAP